MPKGSIRAAGAGIKAPSQGSVTQDLSAALATFMAGIQEEERYQEEQRLKQIQLDIEKQRAEAATKSAEAQMLASETGERQQEFTEETYPQEYELRGRQIGAQETQAGAYATDVGHRIQTFETTDAGARRALIRDFGYSEEEVNSWPPGIALDEYKNNWAMRQEQLRARTSVASGTLMLAAELLPRELQAQEALQSRYADAVAARDAALPMLTQFVIDPETGQIYSGTELPPERASALDEQGLDQPRPQPLAAQTDPVLIDQVKNAIYSQIDPQGAEYLQQLEQEVRTTSGALNTRIGQLQQLLDQGLLTSLSPTGTGTIGPGQAGVGTDATMGSPKANWSEMGVERRRQAEEAFLNLVPWPETFFRYLPTHQERGFPIDQLLGEAGTSLDEYIMQHQEAYNLVKALGYDLPRRTSGIGPQPDPGGNINLGGSGSSESLEVSPGSPNQDKQKTIGTIKDLLSGGINGDVRDLRDYIQRSVHEGVISLDEALDAITPEGKGPEQLQLLRKAFKSQIPFRLTLGNIKDLYLGSRPKEPGAFSNVMPPGGY